MGDDDGELGDFEDYGEEDDEEVDPVAAPTEEEAWEEIRSLRPLDEENPIGLDPRIGVKDLAWDRAKPGSKVYVVAELAPTVEEYYEAFPDAPAFDDYAGNVVARYTPSDTVFACVYVGNSLTKVDTNLTAYPMPESRLTRFPAEEASMVGGSEVEFERTPVYGETDAPVAVSTGVANWPDIARERGALSDDEEPEETEE